MPSPRLRSLVAAPSTHSGGSRGRHEPGLPLLPPVPRPRKVHAARRRTDRSRPGTGGPVRAGSGDSPIPAGFTYLASSSTTTSRSTAPRASPPARSTPRRSSRAGRPPWNSTACTAAGPDGLSGAVRGGQGAFEDRHDHRPADLRRDRHLPERPAAPPGERPTNPKKAIIGDPRNDENLIVAQTHLAFLKFHNKVVDHLQAAERPPANCSRRPARRSSSTTSRSCSTTSCRAWSTRPFRGRPRRTAARSTSPRARRRERTCACRSSSPWPPTGWATA